MKKKSLAILIVIALVLIFVLAGCSGIKTNKDYYLYSFEFEKGTFVQNLAKISFDKDTYTSYDNTGTVDDIGEYLIEDSVISLVPDKIGDANRIARTANMYLYDTYIIDPTLISSRITLTQFGDREKIEGLYDAGFYLKDGKIYDSYDGSNIIESYTEKVGEYKFNKNKDFINIEMDDGTKDCLLTFTYTDNLGQETRAFAPVFYSHKNPKVEAMKDAVVQMYTQVFENKSSDGSSANYELKLISFPDKNVFNNNVSFEIVGANPNATLSGNTLSYTGTGSVDIEYKYGNITGVQTVRIVDMNIRANLPDASRTFKVGDVEDYDDILSLIVDYDFTWLANESVILTSNDKAVAKEQQVEFNKAGTVEATLQVRYVTAYADGSTSFVTLSVSVHLIIED